MPKESMPLKISTKEQLADNIRRDRLFTGIARLRPHVNDSQMRTLLQPDQGEKGKALWLSLMKSGNPAIIEALADIFTGMGLNPDDFTQGDASG